MTEIQPGDIPRFEGRAVEGVVTKMTIPTDVPNDLGLVVSIDDVVQVLSIYKVIDVGHGVDKDGNLVRRQVLRLQEAVPAPFDPNDPDDDGVQRLLSKPGAGQVKTGTTGQATP